MIYGNIVKQYERNTYGVANVVNIDESSFILESLYKEQEVYNNLLENCIDSNKREILEAKYEVIQEAVGAAIIAAIIAVIGAIIGILVMITKLLGKGSSTILDKCKKIEKFDIEEFERKMEEENKQILKEIWDDNPSKITRFNNHVFDFIDGICFTTNDEFLVTMNKYIAELESSNPNENAIKDMNEILNKVRIESENIFINGKEATKDDIENALLHEINNSDQLNPLNTPINLFKARIKEMKNYISECNKMIGEYKKLKEKFTKLKDKKLLSDEEEKQYKMSNKDFFESIVKTLKRIQNILMATSNVVNEQIKLDSHILSVLDRFFAKIDLG